MTSGVEEKKQQAPQSRASVELAVDIERVRLGGATILEGVQFEVEAGAWVGLLGPNGSGKTTLLRAISAHVPFEGTIRLAGRDVHNWPDAERAQHLAFLRQRTDLAFDFPVEELVLLGRSPHKGWLEGYHSDDRAQAQAALAQVNMEAFAERSVQSLSGGELQRVLLAQALVQDAALLLLDEPTVHLDVHYQFAFLRQVKRLVEGGYTVLSVFHDLEQAARHADRLLLLDRGALVADGAPADVLTPARIASVFRMEADVFITNDDRLRIDYLGPV